MYFHHKAILLVLGFLGFPGMLLGNSHLQYPALVASAKIIEAKDKMGNEQKIEKPGHFSSEVSDKMMILLSARETRNPVSDSAPIQYFWELLAGDSEAITLSAGSGMDIRA